LKLTPEQLKADIDGLIIEDHQVSHGGMEKLLHVEREVTGCYLSNVPFAPFYRDIAARGCVSPEEIRNGDVANPSFVGLLRDFRTTTIKNGKNKGAEMAFLAFAGVGDDMEVVCFSDQWNHWRDAWKQYNHDYVERGSVYVVSVRPDRGGQSFILESMERLSSVVK